MKKILALIMAVLLLLAFCSCGVEGGTATTNQTSVSTSADSTADTSAVTTEIISTDSDYFADGDYKEVSGEAPDAEITLSGDSGTISDTTRGSSGATVTITSKGVYRVTGSSEDVTIVVADDAESGNVAWVNTGSRRMREAYSAWARSADSQRQSLLLRHHIDSVDIATDQDYVKALMGLFQKR